MLLVRSGGGEVEWALNSNEIVGSIREQIWGSSTPIKSDAWVGQMRHWLFPWDLFLNLSSLYLSDIEYDSNAHFCLFSKLLIRDMGV